MGYMAIFFGRLANAGSRGSLRAPDTSPFQTLAFSHWPKQDKWPSPDSRDGERDSSLDERSHSYTANGWAWILVLL